MKRKNAFFDLIDPDFYVFYAAFRSPDPARTLRVYRPSNRREDPLFLDLAADPCIACNRARDGDHQANARPKIIVSRASR